MKKTPIMISALVCPGFGQFMQGRRVVGAVYLVLILATCIAIMVFFINIVISFCKCGFALEYSEHLGRNVAGMAVSFAMSMIIYILSLIDTIKAEKNRKPPAVPRS